MPTKSSAFCSSTVVPSTGGTRKPSGTGLVVMASPFPSGRQVRGACGVGHHLPGRRPAQRSLTLGRDLGGDRASRDTSECEGVADVETAVLVPAVGGADDPGCIQPRDHLPEGIEDL